MRYECFNCEKSFDEHENGMCPYCHSTNFADKQEEEIVYQREKRRTKAEVILEAIRKTEVGSDIILHNNDMSIWCILTVKCKEHKEDKSDDGGK